MAIAGETSLYIVDLAISDFSVIDTIIFTFKGKGIVTKTYPKDITYQSGKFFIPLRQQDTISLQGNFDIQAQINYKNKSVAKTSVGSGEINSTLATKIIDGNMPSGNEANITLTIEGNVIIASVGGGSGAKVQSDWKQTNSTKEDFIKNKITKLSELTNDVGFINTETDPTVPSWAKQPNKPAYTASEVGALPSDTPIPSAYTLPTASASVLGGVKIGSRLSINSGVLSADIQSPQMETDNTTGGTITKSLTANVMCKFTQPVSILDITLTESTGYAEYNFSFTTSSTGCNLSLPSTISWDGGTAPTLEANKKYQVSILDNVAMISKGVSV